MHDTQDLFLRAARDKFRFPSKIGELVAEQLWTLPLQSDRTANLDDVARGLNAELKAATEESFVTPVRNDKRPALEAKLELVKLIIAIKLEEAAAAKKRAQTAERRRMLEEAIAQADMRDLASASKDDLLKKLRELESEEAGK